MDLPQVPTDNLYKFMSISGIILVIASLIPFLHSHNLMFDIIKIEGEYKILEKETVWTSNNMQFLKNDVSNLKQRVDETLEIVFGQPSKINKDDSMDVNNADIRSDVYDISDELQIIQKRFEDIEDKVNSQSLLELKLQTKKEELKYLNKITNLELFVGIFIHIAGIILSITGFKLWYKRLQLPQDKIVQAQANDRSNKTK